MIVAGYGRLRRMRTHFAGLTSTSAGHARTSGRPLDDCRGFSIIEVVVVVGIVAVLSLALLAGISRQDGGVHGGALAFQAIVGAARSLAASTDDGVGASGATIQVKREKAQTSVSIYRYRPTSGRIAPPEREPGFPQLTTPVEISFAGSTTFAIFLSSSGQAALQTDFDVSQGGTLASEPSCAAGGETIAFRSGRTEESGIITCEMAQLKL